MELLIFSDKFKGAQQGSPAVANSVCPSMSHALPQVQQFGDMMLGMQEKQAARRKEEIKEMGDALGGALGAAMKPMTDAFGMMAQAMMLSMAGPMAMGGQMGMGMGGQAGV